MSKRAKIIIAVILTALILLALWYMRPQTLDATIDLEGKTVTSMAVTGMFIEDSWDASGMYRAVHKSYTIDSETADAGAILDILRTSRYSRALRSLLSPDSAGLSSTGGTISISMVLDNEEFVTMTVGGIVTFGLPGRDGFTIARADDSLFVLLGEYVRANGVEN